MARSVWKGPILNSTLSNMSRKSTILPFHVGKTVNIHNGKSQISLLVKEEMISKKFGEFAWTTKDFSYKKKDDNKKKRF